MWAAAHAEGLNTSNCSDKDTNIQGLRWNRHVDKVGKENYTETFLLGVCSGHFFLKQRKSIDDNHIKIYPWKNFEGWRWKKVAENPILYQTFVSTFWTSAYYSYAS